MSDVNISSTEVYLDSTGTTACSMVYSVIQCNVLAVNCTQPLIVNRQYIATGYCEDTEQLGNSMFTFSVSLSKNIV